MIKETGDVTGIEEYLDNNYYKKFVAYIEFEERPKLKLGKAEVIQDD